MVQLLPDYFSIRIIDRVNILMGSMSYLSVIESYHDYQSVVHDLISSILTGVTQPDLFEDPGALMTAMRDIGAHYPFVELLYTLDAAGIQTSDNVIASKEGIKALPGAKNMDRSQRPYYQMASKNDTIAITSPYMSTATGNLCLSAAVKWRGRDGVTIGYLVVDINLSSIIEFLRGDEMRRQTVPVFRAVYSLMVVGLMAVAGIMLYFAFRDLLGILPLSIPHEHHSYKLFGIIIFRAAEKINFPILGWIIATEFFKIPFPKRRKNTMKAI